MTRTEIHGQQTNQLAIQFFSKVFFKDMDMISGLPDELILKIFSFVPTKVAVSTRVLSKRWEYLWMWLPKLEYSSIYCSESECKRLQCFLDKNLPLQKAPVIESFRLKLSRYFKPKNINLWVVIAVSHRVRELEILYGHYTAKPNVLPSNLYTCKSLVILKLNGGILLDVPRMGSLPSLKTLKLKRVRYFNEETLQRFLSHCPILEVLVVDLRARGPENLRDRDMTGKLTVVVPSLQSLSLYIPYYHDRIEGVVIKTPSLKYFKLKDHNWKSHYCLVEKMPYLIEAYVACLDIKSLMGSIKSVKRLAICAKAMCNEGFVFNQLEHLALSLPKDSSNQLVLLLNAFSNLKRLDLYFMHYHETPNMDDWNQPSTVPECLLSSLQTLNWSPYTGKPQERDIAVYILKHAAHLKTATFTAFEATGEITKDEMIKELALSSRASVTCQLIFD